MFCSLIRVANITAPQTEGEDMRLAGPLHRREEICFAEPYNIREEIASRAYRQKSSKVSVFKPIEST